MGDDTTSVTAALFGLAGFEILAAAEVGGELELLAELTPGRSPRPIDTPWADDHRTSPFGRLAKGGGYQTSTC